jgi:hypothetical protein
VVSEPHFRFEALLTLSAAEHGVVGIIFAWANIRLTLATDGEFVVLQTIQFTVPIQTWYAADLQAAILGFAGDGTLAGSDRIDLKDIRCNSGAFAENYDAVNNVLNLTDGTRVAVIHFVGTCQEANFSFVSDGQNGTIVYDPPVGSDLPVIPLH